MPSGNVAWMIAEDWLSELTNPAALSALSGTVNDVGASGATVSLMAVSRVVLEFPAGSVTVTASGSGPSGTVAQVERADDVPVVPAVEPDALPADRDDDAVGRIGGLREPGDDRDRAGRGRVHVAVRILIAARHAEAGGVIGRRACPS